MQIFVLLFWFGDGFVRIDLKKIIFWLINIVFKTFFTCVCFVSKMAVNKCAYLGVFGLNIFYFCDLCHIVFKIASHLHCVC